MRKFYSVLIVLLLTVAWCPKALGQSLYYVKSNSTGANNGTSWANAFTSVQSALDAAVAGDQIWVATGTYLPSKDVDGNATPSDYRTKTFVLKDGVRMYGGFAGTELTLDERTKSSIADNPTVLSGDYHNNDGANFANYGDNACRIVVANGLTSATVFDGFIVKGGKTAISGSFLGVSSGSEMGAGMFITNSGTHLTIRNCVFTSNSAGIYAGGILINASSPTLLNCVIENNRSGFGGGLHLLGAFPTFINTVFAKNSASYGGALLNNSASNPTFINCTFFQNNGTTQGGAITNFNGSGASLKNCIVWGNTSSDGPAFYSSGGTTTATYSNIQGGYSGTGNINRDPIFSGSHDLDGADNKWMTSDDGLTLREISVSANTGRNEDVSSEVVEDITGDDRIQSIVNMGAYEKLTPPLTIYVKAGAGGANNGTSWANAYTSLQSALDAAVTGDQIWVATGTYLPSKDVDGNATPADHRTKTFVLKNGVRMYGGFAGTEITLDERTKSSIADNPTVLSGDYNNNDGANFANYGDNACRIVVANGLTSATVFDGFIVKGGKTAISGSFLGVSSGSEMGAGMFITNSGTHLTIRNCVFTSNSAGIYAGGILINASSPTLLNCVIENNRSGFGGGLHLLSAFPTFINTVFAKNSASYGGALLNNSASNPTFINCTFFQNNGTTQGGAITNFNGSGASLKNCIVWGNTSSDGPAFYSSGGTTTATYSNIQGGYSGTGNINRDPIFSGAHDLDGADNKWMTSDDGLTLREISVSANTGRNEDVPSEVGEDITGDDRIQSIVNMGAYEKLTPSLTIYVKSGAGGANNGTSWANAFTSLQLALDAAVTGDQIWVATGTYLPSKDVDGNATPSDYRTKTFVLKNGVRMYGGFAGTETTLDERTKSSIADNPTVLSGDYNNNDGANFANYGDNACRIVVANGLTSATVFDGFIVKGGKTAISGSFLGVSSGSEMGAGMFITNSGTHLTIRNCVFTSNSAAIYAGGILINASSPTLLNCVIENNRSGFGGGLHLLSAFPTFINTVFAKNSASYGGALLNNSASNPAFINCTFFKNNGTTQGGAITNFNGSGASLKNCIVWGNTSSDGPAFYSSGGTTTATYSNIQGGYTGTGNIDTDPLFASTTDLDGADDKWMTADDGLAFLSNSPCANTGANDLVATIDWDIVGDMRILDSQVNIGAYENLGKTTPSISWATPAGITYGTPLSSAELNATSNVSGTVSYFTDASKTINASGALLSAGTHSLYAVITPDDATTFNQMQAIVSIEVAKATITVTADEVTKIYGDADPTLTYTVTSGSLVDDDEFSGELSRASGEDVGVYSIDQNSLALNSNYDLTFVANSFTISERAITVKANSLSKQYGDADPSLTYSITAGSLVGTDDFSGEIARIAGEDVGDYELTQNTLALNSNYVLTFVSDLFTITKRAITVTADAKSKEYGEADPELTYSITNGSLLDSDAFSGVILRVAGETPGEYAIEQNTLSLNSYYDLSFVSANLTIAKRVVEVTPTDISKIYGDGNPVLSYEITSGSLLDGDEFSGTLGREAGESVGSYAIEQNSLSLETYYDLTVLPATFTITPRPVTVTVNAISKIYGESDPLLTYSITSGSLVPGDAFTGSLDRSSGENVGTYNIYQNTLALSSNYELDFVANQFTITPKSITIMADQISKTYGDDEPTLTFSIVSGELVTGDSFTGILSRANNENVGSYEIEQNTLALNDNYELTFVSNNFRILQREIEVTANPATKIYGDTEPVLTYSITSGSLVGADSFTGNIARENAEAVGTYSIHQHTLSLSSNYKMTFISGDFTITHRPITVTAADNVKQYGDEDPLLDFSVTSGSLVPGDDFSGTITRVSGENIGKYDIIQNTLSLNSNYNITFEAGTFTIAPRAITVTANAATKMYGDTDPALTYSITSGSLLQGDVFEGSITRAPGEQVGSFEILQNTLSLNPNYTLTFVPGQFSITRRAITVTADAATKTYGQLDPSLTYSITSGSLLENDSFSGTIARAEGEDVGSYAIERNTLALNQNYVLTFVSKNFTITKATQVITFAELAEVNYGQEPFTLNATTSSGLPVTYISSNTNVATIEGTTLTIVGKGSTVITAQQEGSSNYLSAVPVEQTLIVNGAVTTVDQPSVSFEPVLVNRTETKTVVISNTGNSTLEILNIVYPTGYNGNIGNTTIAAGTSQALELSFSPTEAKVYEGVVELTVNTQQGTVLIAVTGEGVTITSSEEDLNKSVNVSPNPAKEQLTIKGLSSKEVKVLGVHDSKGNPVSMTFTDAGTGNFSANVQSLSAGVYFITIQNGSDIITKRFVKL